MSGRKSLRISVFCDSGSPLNERFYEQFKCSCWTIVKEINGSCKRCFWKIFYWLLRSDQLSDMYEQFSYHNGTIHWFIRFKHHQGHRTFYSFHMIILPVVDPDERLSVRRATSIQFILNNTFPSPKPPPWLWWQVELSVTVASINILLQ